MAEDTNIQPMQSDFEQIKKVTEKGKEYWSARGLATALGYGCAEFRLVQDREYLSDFDKEIKNWKELGLFDEDNSI